MCLNLVTNRPDDHLIHCFKEVSHAKLGNFFEKPTVNPDQKTVEPFEIDKMMLWWLHPSFLLLIRTWWGWSYWHYVIDYSLFVWHWLLFIILVLYYVIIFIICYICIFQIQKVKILENFDLIFVGLNKISWAPLLNSPPRGKCRKI